MPSVVLTGIRVPTIKRKSHNLDAALLRRAKLALGVRTETEAIHEALRAILVGEQLVRDPRGRLYRAPHRCSGRNREHRRLRPDPAVSPASCALDGRALAGARRL